MSLRAGASRDECLIRQPMAAAARCAQRVLTEPYAAFGRRLPS